MKKILSTILTSTLALMSLSACGGQTQINPGMAYGPQYGQTPYQQSGYAYQNPNLMAQQTAGQNTALTSPALQQPQQSYATQQPAAVQPTQTQAPVAAQPRTTTQTSTRTAATTTRTTATATAPRTAAPTAAAAPKISAAQALLINARKRVQTLNSASATVNCFETNAEKGPTNLKANMSFLNGKTKLEVISHQNSLFVGAKLSYQSGADKVTARPAGALGLVTVSAPMSDERILTRRGYRLDQIDVFAIANRLLNGNVEPKVLGKTQVNGRNIAIIEFKNANDFDRSVTRELLGIDMETYFVHIHEMYAGSELVFSLKLENLQINAPLTAKDMEV